MLDFFGAEFESDSFEEMWEVSILYGILLLRSPTPPPHDCGTVEPSKRGGRGEADALVHRINCDFAIIGERGGRERERAIFRCRPLKLRRCKYPP